MIGGCSQGEAGRANGGWRAAAERGRVAIELDSSRI